MIEAAGRKANKGPTCFLCGGAPDHELKVGRAVKRACDTCLGDLLDGTVRLGDEISARGCMLCGLMLRHPLHLRVGKYSVAACSSFIDDIVRDMAPS